MKEQLEDTSGQMTVELAVVLPVVIIIAVIAINALQFFALCASFDRVSSQLVRVYAASPSYNSDISRCCAQIEQALQDSFEENESLTVSVSCASVGLDLQEFKATISYLPSLFGLGLKSEVFGVALPCLTHETRFVVDSYRPGIFV